MNANYMEKEVKIEESELAAIAKLAEAAARVLRELPNQDIEKIREDS